MGWSDGDGGGSFGGGDGGSFGGGSGFGGGGSGSGFGGALLGGLLGSALGRRRGYRRGGGCGCGGCLTFVIVVIVALALISQLRTHSPSGTSSSDANTNIVSSLTTQDEPTPQTTSSDAVKQSDYYTDADGDWIHAPAELEEGLRYFAEKTEVQPFVYILPNGTTTSRNELKSMAKTYYGQLFDDENHFLLVFCDSGRGTFNCGYYEGTDARQVMDDTAVDVLARKLKANYKKVKNEETMFSEAFRATADSIVEANAGAS